MGKNRDFKRDMNNVEKVTSIEKLKEYASGKVVKLPSFGEGQPFYAVLKRPSLMCMVRDGKIPNTLITKVNALFSNDVEHVEQVEDPNMMKDMIDVLEIIAEATLVKPSFLELKEAGIELTDDQLMFLFTYSQRGVKALESFR